MAEPTSPDLRASDAERERVAVALREHAAAGRLEVEELEERLSLAYAAHTRGELAALRADLPPLEAPRPAGASSTRRVTAERASRLGGWIALSVLLIAIWALTGAGYFWPVWPILGTAFGVFGDSRRGTGGHGCRHRGS